MSSSFPKSVVVSSFGKCPAQRNFCAGDAVSHFIQVSDTHIIAGTAALSDAGADGEGRLCRMLYNTDLPCAEDSGQAIICSPKLFANF